MAEKMVRKSKGPPPKSKGKKMAYIPTEENEEEAMEVVDDYPIQMPVEEPSSKSGLSRNGKTHGFENLPPQKLTKMNTKSLPAQMVEQSIVSSKNVILPRGLADGIKLSDPTAHPYHPSWASLPPIATTHNLHSTLETSTDSTSIKAFRDIFFEHAKTSGKLECDASALLTDAHLYELSQLQWSQLRSIQIRACPHITSYGLKYIRSIAEKEKDSQIKVNVELMQHALNMMEEKNDFTNESITKLEAFFGQSKKTSVAKVLIYHAASDNDPILSARQMISSQIQKPKGNAPMLVNYSSSTHEQCEVALLECASSILFKELSTSFHPQIIYLVVSTVDDVLRCFFSVDCNTSYTLLHHQQIRLILNSDEPVDQFLSNIHSRLETISQSAHELYTQFVAENIARVSENDDFRRNHHLSTLLHVQTKCEMLLKILNKDQCLHSKQKDPSFLSNYMMKDAVKHADSLHTFSTSDQSSGKVLTTNESITKLMDELMSKAKDQQKKSTVQNSPKLAELYFRHKLTTDRVLDVHSTSNGRSYLVADIEWFCQTLNNLASLEVRSHRRTEQIVEQLKRTLGTNVRLISKHDLKRVNANEDEIDFFQWLFSAWNIAYPVTTDDPRDDNMFVLFNSISSAPPVPLSTVWSELWPTSEYELNVRFHLSHPCDPSILFYLYKLFPSQKLLLASRDFLLIQEGGIEILVQYHHQTNKESSIQITYRMLNLNTTTNDQDASNGFISELFEYLVREYYVITWAYLFKLDYAFKVEVVGRTITNLFEATTGNEFMQSKWQHLALYHYSPAPSLTSLCSVCGLRPTANKSLYNACTTLSPARETTDNEEKAKDPTGFVTINLDKQPLSYTGKHSLRPDGCNSFEVIFLCTDNDDESSKQPVISFIEIGCLAKNVDIKEDEQVLFQYGIEHNQEAETPEVQESRRTSYLDEIRNFGGLSGLKRAKKKAKSSNELQKLYNGLRLRIDILFTRKSNTYELVFSINDVPWSRKTFKRKSGRTMFQPFIQSPGIFKSPRSMKLVIRHNKSALDRAIVKAYTPNIPNNPWRVGMRVEAKDRKNQSILAIANVVEVYEDNRIRINFDGWSSTYDYTVETDNSDLHPCGYWEYMQRVVYKNPNTAKVAPHMTFSRFDKPRSYSGPFAWRNYLTEINEEPAPYECFNYLQTEGMPIDYFPHGITKAEFTRLSCRHYFNARVKYRAMNTFVQDEIVDQVLTGHHFPFMSPTAETNPGLVLLPTPLDISTLTYPCLKQFQDPANIVLHMTCNHRSVSPLDSTTIISGTHLLDTKGNSMSKQELDMSVITLCMITAIDLARKQKHLIAPSIAQLISDNNNSLSKAQVDAYLRRWLDFSTYITCLFSTYFYVRLSVPEASKINTDQLYMSYNDRELFSAFQNNLFSIKIAETVFPSTFYQQFGKFGECYYCCLFRDDETKTKISDTSFQRRLDLVGDYASIIFYLEWKKPEKNVLENRLILNDDFFVKLNGLEYIDLDNVIVDRFQVNPKNTDALKNLTYLSLENNDLTTIDVDFHHLKKLIHLKLSQNPFESLPVNLFSSKSLQSVELLQLGRLTEIDANTRFSSELKTLQINESVLTTLPPTLGVDARSKLTKLIVNAVPWWRPEGMSVNEVVMEESFMKKFLPFLDKDELMQIYKTYDEDMNGVLSYAEINLMNAHLYRYVSRFRPTQTKVPSSGRSSVEPGNNTDLDLFKQDSSISDPSGFPTTIFFLENLTELSLEYQAIKKVPDAIKGLRSLNIFNLNYCVELETISAEVGLLPLRELNLTGCVSLKTPGIEITRRGLSQTMAFLQRLISGSTACKRTKLMLVGLGGAGKTSLVRTFRETYSSSPPTVTDGIDIVKWKVPLPETNDVLEFSVWDFAGQSVYYHTHQFFLAKKAVYVLAWNIRLGAEHAGLDFWLSSICCHAPNAPIFVVGTHMDQVSRIDLRQDDLKRRYPQIAGFFHVSTQTKENTNELTESIIRTTLALPYMDELIPQAWLKFESLITARSEDILEYKQASDIAHEAGIFEPEEVLQAVQFLHDLGSLQYFPSEHLKNYVVINPQWIVNVMACIVSIKDSPVKNGRLHHSDIGIIWKDYERQLHPWILKLTEAFDLTFPVPDQNLNLVPCLLPEEEPEYTWNEDTNDAQTKEIKVVYTFNYLPAGLFNRAQVRLFQFSDKSTIWRYGSLLMKNNHRAVVIRDDDRHIVIKIQGVRPDNILFLIHEVFEGLVNESFFGVTYDIAFPCPDCVELGTNEPWQFSSSLISRAIELKSPSIQCYRFFHVASVTDLQALVPPDSKSNYDLHLEYSVRDLKSYKQNVAVDAVYIYPPEHIPTTAEIETKVDPRRILDDLTKRGLKIWTPESMKEFRIENHYLIIKEAKLILFGISTELLTNVENKNLCDALQTILSIIRKPIIPILFGTDMKWKESDIGVTLLDKLYVNMQNPKRYENRIIDLFDVIEQDSDKNSKKQQLRDQPTDVFISYCWANSHEAVNKGTKPTATSIGWGDPRSLKEYLEGRGLTVWLDIIRLGKSGVLQDIVHGLKNTRLVIACVSDEYTQSEVCRNEFLFAKNTLRLPVILAVFGNGDKWRTTEVGMCGLTCPQVNFQFENPTAFEEIYTYIQKNLPKQNTSVKDAASNTTSDTTQKTTAAYQELFELTQRKFLRLTSSFAETMSTRAYPRLFALDFLGEKEKSGQELARLEIAGQMNTQRAKTETDNARDLEAERQRDEELRRVQQEDVAKTDEKPAPKEKAKTLCIRALCEHEENWHAAGSPFEITDKPTLNNCASYLTRIMLLLKQSDLALEILTSDEGEVELQKLADLATSGNVEVKDSYGHLRRWMMDCDSEEKFTGLKQCLMPSGKVLWLCEEHQKLPRVTFVTESVAGGYGRPQVEEKSEIMKALAKLNERIANNEMPQPSTKARNVRSARRQSSRIQTPTKRHSQRYSRQESTSVKAQPDNLLEIDKNEGKNNVDDADGVSTANRRDNTKPEDEPETVSRDCSIM